MSPVPIPPDFPESAPTGAVPGVQPKLLARKAGDIFVAGISEADTRARYVTCEDLAHQLVSYSARKRVENQQWSETQLADGVARSVRQRAFGWGLSPAETEWVLKRVAALTATTKEEK
jgi:hypothetical protein